MLCGDSQVISLTPSVFSLFYCSIFSGSIKSWFDQSVQSAAHDFTSVRLRLLVLLHLILINAFSEATTSKIDAPSRILQLVHFANRRANKQLRGREEEIQSWLPPAFAASFASLTLPTGPEARTKALLNVFAEAMIKVGDPLVRLTSRMRRKSGPLRSYQPLLIDSVSSATVVDASNGRWSFSLANLAPVVHSWEGVKVDRRVAEEEDEDKEADKETVQATPTAASAAGVGGGEDLQREMEEAVSRALADIGRSAEAEAAHEAALLERMLGRLHAWISSARERLRLAALSPEERAVQRARALMDADAAERKRAGLAPRFTKEYTDLLASEGAAAALACENGVMALSAVVETQLKSKTQQRAQQAPAAGSQTGVGAGGASAPPSSQVAAKVLSFAYLPAALHDADDARGGIANPFAGPAFAPPSSASDRDRRRDPLAEAVQLIARLSEHRALLHADHWSTPQHHKSSREWLLGVLHEARARCSEAEALCRTAAGS